MIIKVYGCKGSMPGPGGNTSCYLVESFGHTLILDAGTGLTQVVPPSGPTNMLISHLHFDHIIGLPGFPPVWGKERGVRVFTKNRDANTGVKQQLFGALRPPYWPVKMETLPGTEVTPVELNAPFKPDEVFTATAFKSNHPDDCVYFKIYDGTKTLIYMLDYEIGTLTEGGYKELVKNCQGADFIIFDATYHPKDYEFCRGFGHSTVEHGVKLANDCGCKGMLFAHFAPHYTREFLDSWPSLLSGTPNPERFHFALDGMELEV